MKRRILRRLRREESGFTLPEMLVTIMVMITVFFALHSIFDMSIRVFSFGNDKTEAVENARLGLERMEREIRAAYPYDKTDDSTTNDYLFPSGGFTSDSITFGNDLDAANEPGYLKVDSDEIITYKRGADPTVLIKEIGGTPQPVVEFVDGLSFEYLDRYGVTAANEKDIHIVRITLTVEVDRGLADPATQALTTDAALRNRTN